MVRSRHGPEMKNDVFVNAIGSTAAARAKGPGGGGGNKVMEKMFISILGVWAGHGHCLVI